ncbi:hypothetical protein GGTG_01617 [Gaeumannomyces tritici R3-111a-1]|uniref:Uncharacterized protein n=1 Tax=Gaeumannomyces tritici (strain R3-111a-1) TaxID=644352 RepID=J3NK35_GAET3|nr:hypothetical protein GGTG_01617 [Gaeumannomyces tritici R3-111a-1]EJT81639.1 hypothetical protein GGTG_01617 [Gaeumannomyces tritici R3-111a-1]
MSRNPSHSVGFLCEARLRSGQPCLMANDFTARQPGSPWPAVLKWIRDNARPSGPSLLVSLPYAGPDSSANVPSTGAQTAHQTVRNIRPMCHPEEVDTAGARQDRPLRADSRVR